ncbi:MAG: TMEM43 family protein [Micropepsaceae bacterium]
MPLISPSEPGRFAHPFMQVFFATVLGFSSAMFLWWSESDAIGTSRSLGDAAEQTVSIDAPRIEPVNEGKLVHTTGEARAGLPVQDPDLDLVFPQALALQRIVEMYQWMEVSNGPSYKYATGWSSTWQDSTRFRVSAGHTNLPMQIASEKFVATDATLGDFALSEEALDTLLPERAVMPTETPRGWLRLADHLYLGLNPFKPSPGDLRISYRLTPAPAQVTVIARQTPATFSSYEMRNGAEILAIREGLHTSDEMLAEANPFASPALWAWRTITLFVLTVSLYVMSKHWARAFGGAQPVPAQSDLHLMRLSGAVALGVCVALISVAWLFRLPFASAAGLVICGGAILTAVRYRNAPLFSPHANLPGAQAQAT